MNGAPRCSPRCKYPAGGSAALKGAELKATGSQHGPQKRILALALDVLKGCSCLGSQKPILVLGLNVGRWWFLICSPLQMCTVNIKVLVTMFALVCFIQLWWWRRGKIAGPVPSLLGVAEVDHFTRGSQEKRFRMINLQFGAPAMVAMSIH